MFGFKKHTKFPFLKYPQITPCYIPQKLFFRPNVFIVFVINNMYDGRVIFKPNKFHLCITKHKKCTLKLKETELATFCSLVNKS